MRERPWIRLVGALLLFVSLGTVGLVAVLNATFQRWSRTEFQALAMANAEFIRASRLPATERLASYLSQMLGVEVHFRLEPGSPGETADASTASRPGRDMVEVPLEPGVTLQLIREKPPLREVLRRPLTLGSLVAFWCLWFGLAWSVVHPYLRSERLAMLGRMATNLAHEIQNPVAAIRLHGQLLARDQPELAALIVDEATTIEGMVNQWMFLARPEPPRRSPLDLGEVLRGTVRLLAPTADHAGVVIDLELGPGLVLEGDARRLGQVFRNLVLNAIQAMPSGGRLRIHARDRAIVFTDTGPGFSPTALQRWGRGMFSEKEGGMGIGLSVARSIVEAHGGRITVSNPPSGGAEVRVQL